MERGNEGITELSGSSKRKLYEVSKASLRESKDESEKLISSSFPELLLDGDAEADLGFEALDFLDLFVTSL